MPGRRTRNSVHTPHHSRGFSIMAPMTLVPMGVSMPLIQSSSKIGKGPRTGPGTEDMFKDHCKHGEEASEARSKEGLVLTEDWLGQHLYLVPVLPLTSCVTLDSHFPHLCLSYNVWGLRESQRRQWVWKHLVKCSEGYRGTQTRF